jgi:type IX secretion system PorP/SprF family membrane protein
MANHRSQWWGASASSFVTTTVSAEVPFSKGKTDNSQVALGLMALSDMSNGGLLKNNYFSTGLSYNQSLDREGKRKLGTGLMLTYGNRLLDRSKFLFQSQFGSFGFNRDIPSSDPIQLPKRSYFDVAAGIHYSSEGKKWNVNMGAGIYHIAQPDISSYEVGNDLMRMRINFQLSLARKLSGGDELDLISLYTKYGYNSILNLGAIYKYKIDGSHLLSRVDAGMLVRVGDSYIGHFAIEAPKWSLGVAYDFIQSDVKTYYNSVQSMEVSFCTFLSSKKKPYKPAAQQFIY